MAKQCFHSHHGGGVKNNLSGGSTWLLFVVKKNKHGPKLEEMFGFVEKHHLESRSSISCCAGGSNTKKNEYQNKTNLWKQNTQKTRKPKQQGIFAAWHRHQGVILVQKVHYQLFPFRHAVGKPCDHHLAIKDEEGIHGTRSNKNQNNKLFPKKTKVIQVLLLL